MFSLWLCLEAPGSEPGGVSTLQKPFGQKEKAVAKMYEKYVS